MAGKYPPQSVSIQHYIRRLLGKAQLRISPIDLMRDLKKTFPGTQRRFFKVSIDAMVQAGELTYSHHFMSSQIELNSSGAVAVSERLVLNSKPNQGDQTTGRVTVMVQSGSAFGRGDHPTTMLALQAVDQIAAKVICVKQKETSMMLDIGTGTGILAIAAAKLGITRAVGVEIDLAACHEAAANVRINQLADRILIVAGDLFALKPVRFDLIVANLRPPTLSRLMPAMAARTVGNGYWILSGFRPEEMIPLQAELPQDFQLIRSQSNRNWAAFTAQRIKR